MIHEDRGILVFIYASTISKIKKKKIINNKRLLGPSWLDNYVAFDRISITWFMYLGLLVFIYASKMSKIKKKKN